MRRVAFILIIGAWLVLSAVLYALVGCFIAFVVVCCAESCETCCAVCCTGCCVVSCVLRHVPSSVCFGSMRDVLCVVGRVLDWLLCTGFCAVLRAVLYDVVCGAACFLAYCLPNYVMPVPRVVYFGLCCPQPCDVRDVVFCVLCYVLYVVLVCALCVVACFVCCMPCCVFYPVVCFASRV